MRRALWVFAAVMAGACMVASAAQAGVIVHTGTFSSDDQVQMYNFTVNVPTLVTVQTFGYAGGVDGVGGSHAAGGFDPIVSLFSSAGMLLGEDDDSSTHVDPITGANFDSLLSLTLNPGLYSVALTEFFNFALGPTLASGFLESGQGNFTSSFGCGASRFCDATGAARDGNYVLQIAGAGVVPEPATWALLAIGLVAVGYFARRQRGATAAQRLPY